MNVCYYFTIESSRKYPCYNPLVLHHVTLSSVILPDDLTNVCVFIVVLSQLVIIFHGLDFFKFCDLAHIKNLARILLVTYAHII